MFDKRTFQQEYLQEGRGEEGAVAHYGINTLNLRKRKSLFMRHSYKTTELCPEKCRSRPTSPTAVEIS